MATIEGFSWSEREIIGKGQFGSVFKGYGEDPSSNDGRVIEVAVKKMDLSVYSKKPAVKKKVETNINREIEILKLLAHCPCIVRLVKHVVQNEGNTIFLFMELCDDDLGGVLAREGVFSAEEAKNFLCQIAEGMNTLRMHKIVHRDLKPGNILIKVDPLTNRRLYKIADFGYARSYNPDIPSEVNIEDTKLYSVAGTVVYMAPEALRNYYSRGKEFYDERVDLWSIGVLLYRCLVGQFAFKAPYGMNDSQVLNLLEKKGDALAFTATKKSHTPGFSVTYIRELPVKHQERLPRDFTEYITKLLKRLLTYDPERRMNFNDFFTSAMECAQRVDVLDVWTGKTHKLKAEDHGSVPALLGTVASLVESCKDADFVVINEEKRLLVSPSAKNEASTCDGFIHKVPLKLIAISPKWIHLKGSVVDALKKHLDEACSFLEKGKQGEARLELFDPFESLWSNSEHLLSALTSFRWCVTKRYGDGLCSLLSVQALAADGYGKAVVSVMSIKKIVELVTSESNESQQSTVAKTSLSELEDQIAETRKELDDFSEIMRVLSTQFAGPTFCATSNFEVQLKSLCNQLAESVSKSDQDDLQMMLHRLVETMCDHLYTAYLEVFQFWDTLLEAEKLVPAIQKRCDELTHKSDTVYAKTFDELCNLQDQDGKSGEVSTTHSHVKDHSTKMQSKAWEPLSYEVKEIYEGEDILKCAVDHLNPMLPTGVWDGSADLKVIHRSLCEIKEILGHYLSVQINFSGSYKPGDVVAFAQTKHPNIYIALQFDQGKRVHLDRRSIEKHKNDFKMISGTPFMLGTVESSSPINAQGHRHDNIVQISLMCSPWAHVHTH